MAIAGSLLIDQDVVTHLSERTMTGNKVALFETTKALWPATINLEKDPDGPHDIYWALEKIVPSDDHWQQIAMWSFHQALDEVVKRASITGASIISPHAISFADFDRRVRSNLAGDDCWAEERAWWVATATND